MGMVTKKGSNLGKVEETQANRNSFHSRGQSHGSALHERGRIGMNNSERNLSSPLSASRHLGTFIRRLSSLPEHRKEFSVVPSHGIEGAKCVLYSLHQVNPPTLTLARVLKDKKTKKKSNLEKIHLGATRQLEDLDRSLHEHETQLNIGDFKQSSTNEIPGASESAIIAYQQVGDHLQKSVARFISGGDQRYIRTMMLLLYGSLLEERNGCRSTTVTGQLGNEVKARGPQISTDSIRRPKRIDHSLTPTKDHPKPERRWRNGTAIQQTGYFSPIPSGAQTAVPLYVNGRSRSNSRAGPFLGSNASSVANTPRSGESFMVPATPQIRSRSNSALGGYFNSTHNLLHPPEHDAIFEKIYTSLKLTIELGQKGIPSIIAQFSKCLDVAQLSENNKPFVNLWSGLILRSKQCLEFCEILRMRLITIKLNDTEVRYARDFWRLCTKLFDSVSKLLDGIKEAKEMELISKDMVLAIQPILKSAKEATHLAYNSPWSALLEAETPERPTTAVPANQHHENQQQQQHRYRSRTGSANSPYLNSIPATPLSAALGPAAQATVPTSASLDRSFAGDVFQRADELLRVQQTIVPRR